jgi:hypothetical protein
VDFRDPKVSWHESSKRWIMPLAVGDYLESFVCARPEKMGISQYFWKK